MRADEFVFVGGHPALDFVNTRTVDRGQRVERLRDFDALLRWTRAANLAGGSLEGLFGAWAGHAEAAAVFARAVELREALRRWLGDDQPGPLLEVVNAQLEHARPEVRLLPEGKGARRVMRYRDTGPVRLLGELARAAESLLCDVRHGHVFRCAARDCEAYFVAQGRTTGRRWCSDRRCGHRARNADYEKTKRHLTDSRRYR